MRGTKVFYYTFFVVAITGALALNAFLNSSVSMAQLDALDINTTQPPLIPALTSNSPSLQVIDQGIKAPAAITEIQVAGDNEFVELYNPNNEPLPLTGMLLLYRGSGTSTITLLNLDTLTIGAKQFVVLGHMSPPELVTLKFDNALNNSTGEVYLANAATPNEVIDKVTWGKVSSDNGYMYDVNPAQAPPAGNSLQRCFRDGEVLYSDPRDTSKEFLVYGNDLPSPGVGVDCEAPVPKVNVVDCAGIQINEIGANQYDQFIELYNSTDKTIPLAGCMLQTNRSTDTYVLAQEELSSGEYLSVPIVSTGLTLTKTTSGTVYILSSDGQVENDSQDYSNLVAGTSWSQFSDGWHQTYTPTPGTENQYEEYPACDSGYYRNLDTGRCNTVPTVNAPADCGPGQYRSPDTGRCRKLAVLAVITPCDEDQYRSPLTNRCRSIVMASTRKPCNDNQYRSEQTNRCRNLPASTVPAAAFAVKPVQESGSEFIGWWALGAVGLLAVGYGVLEWRREFVTIVRRVHGRFHK